MLMLAIHQAEQRLQKVRRVKVHEKERATLERELAALKDAKEQADGNLLAKWRSGFRFHEGATTRSDVLDLPAGDSPELFRNDRDQLVRQPLTRKDIPPNVQKTNSSSNPAISNRHITRLRASDRSKHK